MARLSTRRVTLYLLLGAIASRAQADVGARINAVIPLSGRAQVALIQMRRLVRNRSTRAAIEEELRVKMRLRALECAQNFIIPRGSSNKWIRRRYGGDPCLAREDAAIAQWLGLRTVGALLALPPLRPMPASAANRLADAQAPIQRVFFAANAGVAAVSSYKDIEVLDLALGVPIQTRLAPGQELLQSISPNGRIYTTRHRAELRFYDAEDGSLLAAPQWCLNGIDCGFYWLNDRTALIESVWNRGPALYDFQSGRSNPFDGQLGAINRVAKLLGASPIYLAFRDSGVTEFRLVYANGEAHADVLQSAQIQLNLIPAQTGGLLAGGATYVNTSGGKLNVTAVSTLRTRPIDLGDFLVERAIPTADPNQVILAGFVRGSRSGLHYYEYSLAKQTVSAIDTSALAGMRFVYDPVQSALYLTAGEALTRVGVLRLGSPVASTTFASSHHSVLSQPQRHEVYGLPPGAAGIVTRGGMIRRFILPGPTKPIPGPIASLAQDAHIEGIGIFGSKPSGSPERATSGPYARTIPGSIIQVHPARTQRPATSAATPKSAAVRVVVRAQHQPLILVLASYANVEWHLEVDAGAKLKAVLITGPHGASVQGEGDVPVVAIGPAYSYVFGSPGYTALQKEVYLWTGKRLSLFQSGLRGEKFTVY